MRVTSCPNSCKRCFVTIPSAIPVVRAYNSASAELKLTVCCVRDHAVSVAFSTAQLRRMCFCALLLGLSNRCLCTRSRTSEVSRFRPSSLHLERLSSISQYASNSSHHSHMMSVRSWNMYNNFPTTVLYIARLSLSSSASDSVVGVLLTVGVVTDFASSKPRTVITSRMYIGVASTEYSRAVCSITLPKKKIFCHPASPFVL